MAALDLSKIYAVYDAKGSRGRAGYHPAMMVALLLYGCCTGKPSSRRIERATREDVGFRVIAGDQHPVVSPVLSDLCAAQVKKGSPWPAR